MRWEKYSPPYCELEAIRKAAIDACDEIDGVKVRICNILRSTSTDCVRFLQDGVVAAPGLCKFDAQSTVGQKFDCNGETRKVTKSAAKIVNAAWQGPLRDGKLEWFGLTHETPLAGEPPFGGLLGTSCDEKNQECKGVPFPISKDWVKLFLAKDPEYDWESMTEVDFFKFLHMSRQRYNSIVGTDDPDLSEFRAAGGKMITW